MKIRYFNKTRFIRRTFQTASLLLFLYLVTVASLPLPENFLPVDLFLRLDPLVAALAPITARVWVASLWPGLVIILSAFFLGRFFCGRICPFGITLDIIGYILRSLKNFITPSKQQKKKTLRELEKTTKFSILYRIKYILLALCTGAAFLGLNIFHWFSPISLITRLYALLANSFGLIATNKGWEWLNPYISENINPSSLSSSFTAILDSLGISTAQLEYLTFEPRNYAALEFIAVFFIFIFALELFKPRFWCRYLCPAGALLGLCSLRPLRKRKVKNCAQCGACVQACPTGAIYGKGTLTAHAECITCNTCIDVCSIQGIHFYKVTNNSNAQHSVEPLLDNPIVSEAGVFSAQNFTYDSLPTRRQILTAFGGGIVIAGITASIPALLPVSLAGTNGCVRPPGALPEADFLDRCIRCGLCIKVCPSNGLQPIWFDAGLNGSFSPVLTSRIGPCEPGCTACGEVCPTGALHKLPRAEKQQSKIGTAEVLQKTCLAWSENRSCVVCEEVCPYGAVNMVGAEAKDSSQGSSLAIPRPVVNAARCYGCGYCERFCPVKDPAIIVKPDGALRLAEPNYSKAASEAGLSLIPINQYDIEKSIPADIPEGELPPGFTE